MRYETKAAAEQIANRNGWTVSFVSQHYAAAMKVSVAGWYCFDHRHQVVR